MIKTTKTNKKSKTEAKTVKAEPMKTEAIKPAPAQAAPLSPVVAAKTTPAPAPTVAPAAPAKPEISLEILNPSAKSVCVAGTFNEWKPEKTPLKPAGNGRWKGSLSIGPGRYEYLFVVDGQWLPDPNARESVQNPFGGTNSVLVVSA